MPESPVRPSPASPNGHASDVLRLDGRVVRIRSVRPEDRQALLDLNDASSDQSIFLRFSSGNRAIAARYVDRVLAPLTREHQELVADIGGEIVGVCGFEALTPDGAEVALLVADRHHKEGLGTLLLEHLADLARQLGYVRFFAEVLLQNRAMLKTFRDLGYERVFETESGLTHVTIELNQTAESVAVIDERDRVADAASMQPVLAPRSIAVIGATTQSDHVGFAVLISLLAGGFRGPVMAVNPRHEEVAGIPCVPTARDLPFPPDLAIVCVPVDQALEVVRDCGERGVRAILMLTAGFGEVNSEGALLEEDILEIVRGHGMRMVGPNCLGVVNTDPAVRLDATFANVHIERGPLAFASQSGVVGLTAIAEAQRRGLGIAQYVSMGNKADVSGNDLLNAWEKNPNIKVIALYLESLGNPRKFARLARRVAETKPIIVIKAGRAGDVAATGPRTRTAIAASSDVALQALFAQSGAIRVATVDQMLDAARVLCQQPLPAGPRVAVIGNAHGPLVLACDALVEAGLTVPEFEFGLSQRISEIAHVNARSNPVDLGMHATPTEMADVVRTVIESGEVDAVLVVAAQVLVPHGDAIISEVADVARGGPLPVVVVRVGEPGAATAGSDGSTVPVFEFAEAAAFALARAHDYVRIRRAGIPSLAERPAGVDLDCARRVVERPDLPEGGWLGPDEVCQLLACFGIAVCPQQVVRSADEAVAAARSLGFPVVVKEADFVAHAERPVPTRVAVNTEDEVAAGYAELAGPNGQPVIVQAMVPSGTEMIVGAVQDRQLGPLVMVGAGGVLADVVSDRVLRLAPLSHQAALSAMDRLRVSRLLDGVGGRPPAQRGPLADLVARVSSMAHELPEVAEIDLNPVICRGDTVTVVNAMIRVGPPPTRIDPFLRALRRPR